MSYIVIFERVAMSMNRLWGQSYHAMVVGLIVGLTFLHSAHVSFAASGGGSDSLTDEVVEVGLFILFRSARTLNLEHLRSFARPFARKI